METEQLCSPADSFRLYFLLPPKRLNAYKPHLAWEKCLKFFPPPIPFSNRERTDDIEPRSKLQLNHNGGTFRLTRV